MLNWGIIGAGGIARVFCNAMRFSKTGRVVAVASRTRKRLDRLAGDFALPRRYYEKSYTPLRVPRFVLPIRVWGTVVDRTKGGRRTSGYRALRQRSIDVRASRWEEYRLDDGFLCPRRTTDGNTLRANRSWRTTLFDGPGADDYRRDRRASL